jgi:S-DNA-T family DNA segregation ATPase FtsK/SpoIIIE
MTDDAYSSGAPLPSVTNSAAARVALKRAAVSIAGGLFGAYGLGAVLTYSPEDPSLNVAADGLTQNLFGGPGALVADIAVQSMGAAAPLAFGALMVAGGARIMRHRLAARIDRSRLAGGAAAIALLSGAASSIPTDLMEGWPLGAGFGGVLGDLVFGMVQGVLSMPGLPLPGALAGLGCAAAGVTAAAWAFQVQGKDVRAAAEAARRAAGKANNAAQRALTYVAEKKPRDAEFEDPRFAQPIDVRTPADPARRARPARAPPRLSSAAGSAYRRSRTSTAWACAATRPSAGAKASAAETRIALQQAF